jgi:hypothetical protein
VNLFNKKSENLICGTAIHLAAGEVSGGFACGMHHMMLLTIGNLIVEHASGCHCQRSEYMGMSIGL